MYCDKIKFIVSVNKNGKCMHISCKFTDCDKRIDFVKAENKKVDK